jgi:hypothetical protein
MSLIFWLDLLVKDVGEEETLITELGEKEVDVRD